MTSKYLEILNNYYSYQNADEHTITLKSLLANALGGSYIVLTNSGTSALLATLYSLGIKRGDYVLCPVNVCPAVVNAIIFLKAHPYFIDVGEDMNLNLSLFPTNEYINCMIYVLRHGVIGEYKRAYEIAKQNKIPIIIDAAQAFVQDTPPFNTLENYADAVIYSFSNGKHISAGGGGVIVTRHSDIASDCEKYINNGAINIPYYETVGLGLKCPLAQTTLITALIELHKHDFDRRIEISSKIITVTKEYGFTPLVDPVNHKNMNALYRLVLSIPAWVDDINNFVNTINQENMLIRCAFPLLLDKHCQAVGIEYKGSGFDYATYLQKTTISIYVDTRINNLFIGQLKNKIHIENIKKKSIL